MLQPGTVVIVTNRDDGESSWWEMDCESPSWETERAIVSAPRPVTRYVHVSCADCERPLDPVFPDVVDAEGRWESLQAADALCVALTGGYGEFLDTIQGPRQAYLCRDCAVALLTAHPWLKDLAAPALSINVGHRCQGEIVWVPEPDCTVDPDRHGWRPIWQVWDPETDRPDPEVFDTFEAAAEHAARHEIPRECVHRGLIGNVHRTRPVPGASDGR